jgi:hypothetical protein
VSGSLPEKIPDFTRGGWERAKPLGIEDVDLVKMGFDPSRIVSGGAEMNI